MRDIDDTGEVAVDANVEPDVLRDDISGGVPAVRVGTDLGGGGGGCSGDGERVGCTGGGSISETGISETSPALPSINGDNIGGGGDCSIITLLRRGEPVRKGEVLRSGEAEGKALGGAEDV